MMRWLVIAVAMLAGCAAQPAAETVKHESAPAINWPARRAVPGHPGDTGIIATIDAPQGLAGFRVQGHLLLTERDRKPLAGLLTAEESANAKGEGDGAFAFYARRGVGAGATSDARYLIFASAPPGDPARIQRTWFAVFPPKADRRGVALLMPGLFGTPDNTLNLVTTRLRNEGWTVLRMMSQPSRFTERHIYDIDPAAPDAPIAEIAKETDDRTAECAYAVQAAFAQLLHDDPALTRLPRIAIGMSGGAMTLPTVLAREPEKYAVAVLIAGGCDFFAITNETNYAFLVDAVRVRWKPDPTSEQLASIDARYLALARLDSYHTAAALLGKPILMIHGDHDGAVPARLGDLLWERLKRPERWVQTAGHEEVFMRLPTQMDRLMAWINSAAQAAKPASR